MRCAEALEQLCHTITKIVALPVVKVKTIASKTMINEISTVTMSTFPSRPDIQIDCHLNSLYRTSFIKCNVNEIGAGEYSIQYTPTVRGRHELSVSAYGQPVAGSPFPVLVCSPPTLLDKPVKVWDGFINPCGITVNSMGEITVTECTGDVVLW